MNQNQIFLQQQYQKNRSIFKYRTDSSMFKISTDFTPPFINNIPSKSYNDNIPYANVIDLENDLRGTNRIWSKCPITKYQQPLHYIKPPRTQYTLN